MLDKILNHLGFIAYMLQRNQNFTVDISSMLRELKIANKQLEMIYIELLKLNNCE